jgi:hypothetical protein
LTYEDGTLHLALCLPNLHKKALCILSDCLNLLNIIFSCQIFVKIYQS